MKWEPMDRIFAISVITMLIGISFAFVFLFEFFFEDNDSTPHQDEYSPPEWATKYIIADIPSNGTEASQINITNATIHIEERQYEVNYQNGSHGQNIGLFCRKFDGDLAIFISTELNNSFISFNHYIYILKSELDNEFESIYVEINRIADICNLTLDWSMAIWNV